MLLCVRDRIRCQFGAKSDMMRDERILRMPDVQVLASCPASVLLATKLYRKLSNVLKR